MRAFIFILLICCILLSGCASQKQSANSTASVLFHVYYTNGTYEEICVADYKVVEGFVITYNSRGQIVYVLDNFFSVEIDRNSTCFNGY